MFYLTLRKWSLGNIPCTKQEHSYENANLLLNETLKGMFSKVVVMFVVNWAQS